MENSFKNYIDSANSVLILLPKNPYFDQVASALTLYLALENKKSVAISCPTPMTVEFNRLVGVDKVTEEVGNRNLVIKFKNYQAQNIERVAYDIENNEFRLSVIPKPQLEAPEKDQLEVSYSGISADAVILVGGGNETHFPPLAKSDLLNAKKAHIGLSSLSASKADIYSFAKTASSTAEIMYGYIKELGLELTSDMASNLLAGLHEGSKNFASQYVTANTFKVASELMQSGAVFTPREATKTFTARDFGQKEKATAPVSTTPAFTPVAPVEVKPEVKPEVKKEVVAEKPTMVAESIAEMTDIDLEDEIEEANAPKSWLEPKIFKGTNSN